MRLSVSKARSHLGEVIMHVQDPNAYAVICRYGKPVAAVVSMAGVRRVWQIEDEEEHGKIRHPLRNIAHKMGTPVTTGRDGKMVTPREAALQVRTLQLTRREERRILANGGLEPVAGGELAEERDVVVARKRWWFW